MSRGLTSALALLLLGSLGCKPKKVTIHNSTTYPVEVFWGDAGAGDADEVDFDDPRLEKALADIERLVGHRVDVSFDVALLPRPRGSFFEQMFDRQVGRIPLELAEMKDHDPELFAQFAPSLKKIVFDYDGARRHMEVEFNPENGALTYVLTYADIGRGSVSFAARQAQQKAVDARFAGRSVRQIPAAELAAYAQWVVDRNHAGEDVLQPMVELLEIWAHVSKAQRPPQDVLSVVRRAVPRHASYLASEYRDRAEGRAASEWLDQAGREYSRFVAAEFAVLTDDAKADVLRSLFPKHTRRGGDHYIRDAYPGLDRVRFGLGLAQQWLSAGAPERFGEGDAAGPLTDLVCPRGAGERPLDSAYCRGQESLWDFASYDEAARKQIAQAIVSVNDPRFTLTALVGMRDANANGMVDVWHRLEKQPKHWLIGARVLGDRIHDDSNRTLARELYDEAVGSWRGHPERRAGYLYILAAPTSNGNVELLQAWDPLHEKTSPNFCAGFAADTQLLIGEREDTYDISYISSREELASKLNVDLALKAEVRGVSGDAKLKLVNEFNGSSNVMTYLVRLTSQFAVRPRGELVLTQLGAEASDAGADAFARRCGTHYVRAIRYGTELYLLIKLTAADESTTSQLEAELGLDGSIAGQSLEGTFGTKLSQAASRADVNVSVELASRGFALPTREGEGGILDELTSGDVSARTFEAVQQARAAMVESTAADIETLANEQADGLLRLNSTPTAVSASLYSGLSNWPGLAGETNYTDLVELTQDNEEYLRELGALMDRMASVYHREVAPFLGAQGAQRAAFQTRDGLEAMQTRDLVPLVERWKDELEPPGAASTGMGDTYGLVEREFSDCWLASSENPLHDCQADLEWDDHPYVNAKLEDYHRERVLPLLYAAAEEAVGTYARAADACEEQVFSARFGAGRGRLHTKSEAESMLNLIAAGDLDWSDADITRAIYYLSSDEDGEAQCAGECSLSGEKMIMTVTPDREIRYRCDCDSNVWGESLLPVCVPPDGPRVLPAAP